MFCAQAPNMEYKMSFHFFSAFKKNRILFAERKYAFHYSQIPIKCLVSIENAVSLDSN